MVYLYNVKFLAVFSYRKDKKVVVRKKTDRSVSKNKSVQSKPNNVIHRKQTIKHTKNQVKLNNNQKQEKVKRIIIDRNILAKYK